MDPAPLKIDFNTDEWTLGEDGWYYCKAVLLAGEETAPLFENVVFDIAAMGNEYQNCTASVNVVAQAVQAANNGAAVEEAQGWPAEAEE